MMEVRMINALHLLWIVPVSLVAGAFCMALVAVNNKIYIKGGDNQ